MMRPVLLAALVGAAVLPSPATAEGIYSFVDSDGVIHVTNAPPDARFRRVRGWRTREGVHRVMLNGRIAPALRPGSTRYDEQIRSAAERHGLPSPLLKAVMAAESNFDPAAVSHKGATGLMQLMPATAREMSVADVLDPVQNIDGGARYLRQLHDQYGGDLEKVLAAYNAGPEAVRRSGGAIPAIPETQAYVRKVISLYESYLRGG